MIFDNKGFTLIELAIVLLIGGILLGTLSSMLLIYLKKANIRMTQTRLESVDEGLQQFLNLNGRLPCPAAIDAGPDTPEYGREVDSDCTSDTHPGTVRVTGRDGRWVRIGAVPVRTINLPDEFAVDAWSARFTYAVTEMLAAPGSYDREEGAISVLDSADNPVLNPSGSGHYVIVSHGPDGLGSFTSAGVDGAPCAAGTLDAENCDDDATFRRTLISGRAAGSAHYDDHMRVRAVSAFGESMPPGAVIPFNLASCPPGWVSYAPATGRSIVGTGDFVDNYDIAGRTAWDFSEEYELGDTGGYATWRLHREELGAEIYDPGMEPVSSGDFRFLHRPPATTAEPAENRPPYIALTYCQKT